jgi:hypothetical protein
VNRAYAYLVSAAVLGAVSYPALWPIEQDGFPLSTYPMFAWPRSRLGSVTSALALGPSGFERPVPPSLVATSEAMQAFATLRRSVRAGPAEARALCQAIASRVAQQDGELAAATQIALVTQVVDSIEYLAGEPTPLERREHVRCPVPGADP